MLFHPSSSPPDGWAFTNNIDINQHQSLEDRLSAAQILVKKKPLCPVVVDDMSDTSAIKYGALPERLYVLQAGKVIYKVRAKPVQALLNFYQPGLCNDNFIARLGALIEGKSLWASSRWLRDKEALSAVIHLALSLDTLQ